MARAEEHQPTDHAREGRIREGLANREPAHGVRDDVHVLRSGRAGQLVQGAPDLPGVHLVALHGIHEGERGNRLPRPSRVHEAIVEQGEVRYVVPPTRHEEDGDGATRRSPHRRCRVRNRVTRLGPGVADGEDRRGREGPKPARNVAQTARFRITVSSPIFPPGAAGGTSRRGWIYSGGSMECSA